MKNQFCPAAHNNPSTTCGSKWVPAFFFTSSTASGKPLALRYTLGETIAEASDYNGQIRYGEDVISRIMFAEKPGGLATMQQVVVATVHSGTVLSVAR